MYGEEPPPPADPAGTGNGRVVALVLSACAVLVAGVFAFSWITAGDGASSPEGAVDRLFDAIDQEDAIGALESLAPGERRALREPVEDIVGELQRLGVLDEFSLSKVPGASISIDDLAYETSELADGVVRVDVVDGTITTSTSTDELPVGPRLREQMEADEPYDDEFANDATVTSFADEPFSLVVVDEDGGWHVSLAYSIVEGMRGDDDPVLPIGGGPEPVGADSPEGAVRDLVDAAVALDAERAITLMPPDEMRALYDYAPLFLPDAAEAAAEMRDEGFGVTVDDLGLSVEGDGDTRRVRFDRFDVSWKGEYDSGSVSYDGECMSTTSTYTYESYGSSSYEGDFSYGFSLDEDGFTEQLDTGQGAAPGSAPETTLPPEPETVTETDQSHFCRGDAVEPEVDEEGYPEPSDPFLFAALGDLDPGLTVVEVDGRWYVSPVRSVLDTLVEMLESISDEEADALFGGWFGGGLFGVTTGEAKFEEVGEAIEGSVPTPTPTLSDEQYDDAVDRCYVRFDDPPPSASDEQVVALYRELESCLLEAYGSGVDGPGQSDGSGEVTETTLLELQPTTTVGQAEGSAEPGLPPGVSTTEVGG